MDRKRGIRFRESTVSWLLIFAICMNALLLAGGMFIYVNGRQAQCRVGNEFRTTLAGILIGVADRSPQPKETLKFLQPELDKPEMQRRDCSIFGK